jgi:hypothetical protein
VFFQPAGFTGRDHLAMDPEVLELKVRVLEGDRCPSTREQNSLEVVVAKELELQ